MLLYFPISGHSWKSISNWKEKSKINLYSKQTFEQWEIKLLLSKVVENYT